MTQGPAGGHLAPEPGTVATPAPEVYRQLGQITRQLHEALNQLGLLPKLQRSADGLQDARARLEYVVTKTGDAAEKVLDLVDTAKQDRAEISDAAQSLRALIAASGLGATQTATGIALVESISTAATRMDDRLTEIMLAQDFHDLTGQVVSRVVVIATDLEESLVRLLLDSAPVELAADSHFSGLSGPVIEGSGRKDVAATQNEVDDLLSSLGF